MYNLSITSFSLIVNLPELTIERIVYYINMNQSINSGIKISKLNASLIISAIGISIYASSLLNAFVWDDNENILNNSLLRSLSNIPYFFTGSTFNSGGMGTLVGSYYKPLVTTIFSLIYAISGNNTFLYHLTQLVVHMACAICVYVLFSYFLNKYLSLFLSLVFLAHPQNVEATAYISALEDPLFLLFGFIALLIAKNSSVTLKSGTALTLFLLLSVLSKESGFIMMTATLIYIFLFDKTKIKRFLLCAGLVVAFYAFLRFIVAGLYFPTHPVFAMTRIDLFERLKTLPAIITFYLSSFFDPKEFTIAHEWVITNLTVLSFWIPMAFSLLFFILVGLFGLILARQDKKMVRPFLFFSTLFILSFATHWQVFPIDLTVADRWFYLPMIGLLGMIGIWLQSIKLRVKHMAQITIAILIIGALGSRTFIRTHDWKDEKTLYSHDIQINKDSFVLEANYGLILIKDGKINEGIKHVKKSIDLAPYRWENWTTLGSAYMISKDFKNAKKYYEVAMKIAPYYVAYENYGQILLFHDSSQKTEAFTKRALTIFPKNAGLWLTYAVAEYKLGNHENALKAAQISYRLESNPQNTYVLSTLQQGLPLEVK